MERKALKPSCHFSTLELDSNRKKKKKKTKKERKKKKGKKRKEKVQERLFFTVLCLDQCKNIFIYLNSPYEIHSLLVSALIAQHYPISVHRTIGTSGTLHLYQFRIVPWSLML